MDNGLFATQDRDQVRGTGMPATTARNEGQGFHPPNVDGRSDLEFDSANSGSANAVDGEISGDLEQDLPTGTFDEGEIITPGPASGAENIPVQADGFPFNVDVLYNPVKYDDCQFDAIANQLMKININRTCKQLREIAVDHLYQNRHFFGHFFFLP